MRFYQDVLEFPLTEMFENRDYGGSTHFFFDIGNGNALAFFDLPGLGLGPYAEVLGGLHHLAISVEPEQWERLKDNLDRAGVAYALVDESSMYFNDPDGARLELISDPLGEMYGTVGRLDRVWSRTDAYARFRDQTSDLQARPSRSWATWPPMTVAATRRSASSRTTSPSPPLVSRPRSGRRRSRGGRPRRRDRGVAERAAR